VQMCIGTRAKPIVRFNLKGNAKYVYDRQLSMSKCTYTKEPQHTLQFREVQVYLYAFISKENHTQAYVVYLIT
jgi:hypothetical protein